jgi:hypothetical protein
MAVKRVIKGVHVIPSITTTAVSRAYGSGDALGFKKAPFRSRWGFDFFTKTKTRAFHVESQVAAFCSTNHLFGLNFRP